MSQSSINIPGNPGSAVSATVVESGVRLRSFADLKASILRTLSLNEQVTIYPSTVTSVNGYPFVFLHDSKGQPGWSATAASGVGGATWIKLGATTVQWTINLSVPYVSQLGPTASLSNNDCGIASLLMLIRFWYQQHGLQVPSVPTVDDLEKYTPMGLPNPPSGLTFPQIGDLATRMGFPTQFVQPMSVDKIVEILNLNKPVMVLMDYSVYYPASYPLAHILVVSGYNSASFLTQDPYLRGANITVSRTTLDAAMKASPGNSVGYQGLYLNV